DDGGPRAAAGGLVRHRKARRRAGTGGLEGDLRARLRDLPAPQRVRRAPEHRRPLPERARDLHQRDHAGEAALDLRRRRADAGLLRHRGPEEPAAELARELTLPRPRRWYRRVVAEAIVRSEGVWKTFRLPHDRPSSLKQRVLHPRRSRAATTLDALKDVSFHVEDGEFFGIIGRNGSGKSTMLKCLAGIYPHDRGSLSVTGRVSPF